MGFLARFFNPTTDSAGDITNPFESTVPEEFIKFESRSLLRSICFDSLARVTGIKPENIPMLYDSPSASGSPFGLVSLLVDAMMSKNDVYIVIKSGVLRAADSNERTMIDMDYSAKASSRVGWKFGFKEFNKMDRLELCLYLEKNAIEACEAGLNLSKSIGVKISKLREAVSLENESVAKAQAKVIVDAIKVGNPWYADSLDSIGCGEYDITPVKGVIEFVNTRKADIFSLPVAYFDGSQKASLSDSGDGTEKALNRGLHLFYMEHLKGVVDELFGRTAFDWQETAKVDSAVSLMRAFDMTETGYMDEKEKIALVRRYLGVI